MPKGMGYGKSSHGDTQSGHKSGTSHAQGADDDAFGPSVPPAKIGPENKTSPEQAKNTIRDDVIEMA